MISLSERLSAAAGLVRSGRPTADIGTDHAYLPLYLALTGRADKIIASDIGKGPLKNAEKTVRKFGLKDKISLVISDGLKNIPRETEEILITGMGGELITDILSECEWIKNDNIHLVLQPMTHSYDVRKFLCGNGFYIDNEKFCLDCGRVYVVMSAYYSGKNEEKDDFYCFFGDKISMRDSVAREYFNKQYKYIKSRRDGLSLTERTEETEKYLHNLNEVLKRAEEYKKQYES